MSTTAEVDRLRGLLRVLTELGEPSSAEQLGNRLCTLLQRRLGVSAAALFTADNTGRLKRAGAVGTRLPDELLPSLARDRDRLRDWAATVGLARAEVAPVALDADPAGLLVLLSATGAPFEPAVLDALGAGVGQALGHVRATQELTRAFAKQDHEQEQLLRAERMRALGDMALGIAHDFNNALNAILGQTGVLGELLAGRSDDRDDRVAALAAVDKLRKVALDAAQTIGRVQEFSGQRRDKEFGAVDFTALVDGIATRLRASARDTVAVEVRLAPGRSVHGNAGELADLVRALVDNAVEAMPDGGRLTLELAAAGDDVALVVGDSGVGMTAAVRRRAFDPFFTTKGSRIKGLGLSVAYGIARRHGGLIEIDSTPGNGTRVRVRLPSLGTATLPSRAPHAAAAPAPSSAPRPTARRVLLVEDDPDNRDAMAALLALSGFDVTPTDCGSAGVRAFAPDHFDVVLTDLGLPDMDGWQVAGEIKQRAPSTPVALITGWGLNLDEDEIRRRGVDLLIKKPLDPRLFLRQLEALLQAGARKPSA